MGNNYYQKNKERPTWKKSREKNQNIFEEEKDKRWKTAQERYQNFTEEEKEKRLLYYLEHKKKLTDYKANYYLAHTK